MPGNCAIAHVTRNPGQPELISKVEAERRSVLSQDDLASRRAWRDRRLMALAADRRERAYAVSRPGSPC